MELITWLFWPEFQSARPYWARPLAACCDGGPNFPWKIALPSKYAAHPTKPVFRQSSKTCCDLELTCPLSWRSPTYVPATLLGCTCSWIFYRTRVRSLFTLVTNWLTDSLTNSLLFSKLYWCDPGVWRWKFKTCWCCNCCWWWSCWQQFVVDLEAEVWSKSQTFVQTLSTRFDQNFEVEVQTRFKAGVCSVFSADLL